jgi:16S rRNA (cytidine1402-2'-O)-methyltransferase
MAQAGNIMKGTLYLIPSALGDSASSADFPGVNLRVIEKLRHFVVEDARTARRFLKKILPAIKIDDLSFQILDEHTQPQDVAVLLAPLMEGTDLGLLSEAGLPCVADPGALLVNFAHENGVKVVPLTGPSSVFLALMASGFNGQNFSFSGYLPIDKKERAVKIRELETLAFQQDQTQVFIETPYRNQQMMEALVETCRTQTRICIAVNLTMPDEMILSRTVEQWKRLKWPEIQKKPAVFLIYR